MTPSLATPPVPALRQRQPLRLGLLPGESTDTVRQQHEGLRLRCQQALGWPVELVVGTSYAATGDALRRQQVDAAYLGPVSYIVQRRGQPLEPFARPTHPGAVGPTFQAVIVVPTESPVTELAQLRGQEIALGDSASTSGHWVPRYQLLGAGLVADRDYTRLPLGAHDAVAQAVADYRAAAGGMSLAVLQRLLAQGRIEAQRVRILAVSNPIPEYMWTFRAGLDANLREDIRATFLTLHDPEVLAAYRASAFIPAVDSDVDRVRTWMESILQARLRDTPIPWQTNEAAIAWPRGTAP